MFTLSTGTVKPSIFTDRRQTGETGHRFANAGPRLNSYSNSYPINEKPTNNINVFIPWDLQYCANQLGQGDLFNGNWVNCNPGFCRRILVSCKISKTVNIFLTTRYNCYTLSQKPVRNHRQKKPVSYFEDPTSKGCRFLMGMFIWFGDISKSVLENNWQIFCGAVIIYFPFLWPHRIDGNFC